MLESVFVQFFPLFSDYSMNMDTKEINIKLILSLGSDIDSGVPEEVETTSKRRGML